MGFGSTRVLFTAWLCAHLGAAYPAPCRAEVQPTPTERALDVQPGATCVSAATLAPQIDAWLGDKGMPAGVHIEVRGDANDARDVAFEVRRGEEPLAYRRFAPAPFVCAQLEATLALAIAMALKASLREELLTELDTTSTQRDRRVDTLALQAHAGTGLLPRRSFGGGVSFGQDFHARFGLRTGVFVDGTRGASLKGAEGSFDTWLLSVQVSGCALFPVDARFRMRACLGAALGALRARGRGYEAAEAHWLAWVALANTLGFSARLSGPFWLDVPVSVFVPLNDVRFRVQQADGAVVSERALPVLGLTVGLAGAYQF